MQTEGIKCCGISGRLFGHNFQSMKTKGGVDIASGVYYQMQYEGPLMEFMDLQRDEYKIICKRCGKNFNETQAESQPHIPNSATADTQS